MQHRVERRMRLDATIGRSGHFRFQVEQVNDIVVIATALKLCAGLLSGQQRLAVRPSQVEGQPRIEAAAEYRCQVWRYSIPQGKGSSQQLVMLSREAILAAEGIGIRSPFFADDQPCGKGRASIGWNQTARNAGADPCKTR